MNTTWYLQSHFVWFKLSNLSIQFFLSFAWRLTIESFCDGHLYLRKRQTPTVTPAKPGDYLLDLHMKPLCIALFACLAWTTVNAQSPATTSTVQPPSPLATIATLDVPRYMGTWFEIAKYPNWFQKKCVSDTRADYKSQAGGSVQVINRCRRENGDMDEAIGEARQTGVATSPKLQVRFAPSWLSGLPFVWGNYWVIDLDDRYQLVAVSEHKREY